VKTFDSLKQLLGNHVIKSISNLLMEPKGMEGAIDGLLPLCCFIGPTNEEDEETLAHLCNELEAHGVAEKLAAILCSSMLSIRTKSKIATLVFYMAKEERFANSLLKEQGAIKALTGLLDSEQEEASSRAAAALANISYWSNITSTFYSHLRVQVAL